jgi:hypothetical protein
VARRRIREVAMLVSAARKMSHSLGNSPWSVQLIAFQTQKWALPENGAPERVRSPFCLLPVISGRLKFRLCIPW